MLEIKNLKAQIDDKKILKGIDLNIKEHEIHVVMGPNGSGKSTLAKTLMGSPEVSVTGGQIKFKNEDITKEDADRRSNLGLFLANQYPVEVPGVNLENFLRLAYNANKSDENKLSVLKFREFVRSKLQIVDLPEEFLERNLNEGFSGGEKKKSEILQMAVLEPSLAILDETDSGLDIESLDLVFKAIRKIYEQSQMALLVITHYDRVFNYIEPDFVHIMRKGEIIKTGGRELINKIQEVGFKNLK